MVSAVLVLYYDKTDVIIEVKRSNYEYWSAEYINVWCEVLKQWAKQFLNKWLKKVTLQNWLTKIINNIVSNEANQA